jgi:hypothetical protein
MANREPKEPIIAREAALKQKKLEQKKAVKSGSGRG